MPLIIALLHRRMIDRLQFYQALGRECSHVNCMLGDEGLYFFALAAVAVDALSKSFVNRSLTVSMGGKNVDKAWSAFCR